MFPLKNRFNSRVNQSNEINMDMCDSEQLDQQQYSSFLDFQHLNIDLCLELIFPYLDLRDLSNVADSCMQMRWAAELTFAHEYRNQIIRMSNEGEDPSETNTIFKVLRCFGQMISKLCLEYSFSTAVVWTHLDKYIAKYCVNSLTELELWNRLTSSDNLEVTFPNVEKVRFINCKLDKTITEFNKRFPQMRSLGLASGYNACTAVSNQRCTMDHFPNLEHLSLHISNPKVQIFSIDHGFREETVLNILKLNPKLRSLNLFLNDYFRMEFVKEISKNGAALDALQITGYPLRFDDVVHFENVKCFNFDQRYSALCTPIPLTFDALETFECHITACSALTHIFDFVRKNPSIRKVKLSFSEECLTHDNIIETKDAFAFVKEIEIDMYVRARSNAEHILFLLNNLDTIQKLILRPSFDCTIDHHSKLEELLSHTRTIDGTKRIIVYQKVN